ncbi:staphylopine family metallophore export MFS transporter CntE [Cohnella sp.]|uniref:staphylopine family metallophore export MFS transporter CntE n=1 Tax=Cohnella sp. TaxID=1883426 RepID=UPI003703D49F
MGALSWPFLRLYLLTLLYFSANSILNVIIPLEGKTLGADNSTIGIIMGAYLFTTMLLRPWAGGWIQRFGPIKILRILLVVNGCALILYTMTGIEGYLVARMMQGACTAFFSMALQLGIIDALPDKDRSQGISMYSLCAYLPGIFGPLVAVGIWQTGEWHHFTIAMVVLAILTGIVGYTARIDRKPGGEKTSTEAEGAGIGMRGSLGQFVRNPHLFKSGLLMLNASLIFGAMSTFVPLYTAQIPAASTAVFLTIQAFVVVGTRFGLRKLIPSDGKWPTRITAGAMALLAVACLCVSMATALPAAVFYTGALLTGIAQALLYPALMTYLSFVLPEGSRNILIGLFVATADLGVSMGSVLMGPIADWMSYSTMYSICAALAMAMTVVALERRSLSSDSKRQVGSMDGMKGTSL